MDRDASIAEFLDRGGIEPHEAVAVVQQLIHGGGDDGSGEAAPAPGPLSIDRVRLGADGSVVWVACDATPAVSEVANLLQCMLPHGTPNVPGALRYAIARARLDVEAPPFDSLADFSRALARFERGDRREVVRKLVERPRAGEGLAVCGPAASPSPRDRRVPTVTVTELRRQLREADQRLFAQVSMARHLPESRVPRSLGGRFAAIAAGVFVGMSLIGAGEAMHLGRASTRPDVSTRPPAAIPAPRASEPASQPAPQPEAPKAVDRDRAQQPRSPRTPTPVAARGRGGKAARAQSSGSPTARGRNRSRQTDAPGIFSRIRFKLVDDTAARRE